MYAGHFAIAAVLKARFSQVPATAVVGGAVFMDVLYAVLLLSGVDRISPDLQAGPYLYFRLEHIDWDHSLLMAALLSCGWGLLWLRRGALVCAVATCAVASHFLLDWVVHNHDLALYPNADLHMGLGLWGRWGTGAWLLEGLWIAVCLGAFWRLSQREQTASPLPIALWIAALFLGLSPWFSPMQAVAAMGMPRAQTVHALLILAGFVVPALFLIRALAARSVRAAQA